MRLARGARWSWLALLGAGVTVAQDCNDGRPDYRGISGPSFPAAQSLLLHLRDKQEMDEMRRHAWGVFQALTEQASSDDRRPIWETWYTKEETFPTNGGPPRLKQAHPEREFEISRKLLLGISRAGPSGLSRDESQLSTIFLLNQEARSHVCQQGLYSQMTLNELLRKAAGEIAGIPEFPPASAAVKAAWWLVRHGKRTAVPVWYSESAGSEDERNGYSKWKRYVIVDPSLTEDQIKPGEMAEGTLPWGTTVRGALVATSRFYSSSFRSDTERQAFSKASAVEVAAGDCAVLVALHVATKEIPDWTWSTFWWHEKPNEGPFAAQRPGTLEGYWRNYLMDTTFSTDTPRRPDGKHKSCFNPWLEATLPRGIASNCMTCHQLAAWQHSGNPLSVPVTLGGLVQDHPYFNDKLKLDYLWSIAFQSR